MDPKLAQRLMAESPAVQDFIQYLFSIVESMDTVNDLTCEDPMETTIEVRARQIAIGKVTDIFKALTEIDTTKKKPSFQPEDYAV